MKKSHVRIIVLRKLKVKAKKSQKSNTYSVEGRQEWEPTKEHKYLIELSRNNASTILMARTRMIDVKKDNFRNKYPDSKNKVIIKSLSSCRTCEKEPDTQEHVLETYTITQAG